MRPFRTIFYTLAFVCIFCIRFDLEAAESDAITTVNPAIPKDELTLLVRPLTRDELVVEAEAWQVLVKDKVRELVDAELAVKHQTKTINAVEQTAKAVEKAKAAAESAEGPEEAEKTADAMNDVAEAIESINAVKEVAEQLEGAEAAVEAAEEEILQDGGSLEDKTTLDEAEKALTADAEKLEEVAAVAERTSQSSAAVKERLLDRVNRLRDERVALSDRMKIVLDELDRKGGESEAFRSYLVAVSGIQLDVSDKDAAWAAVRGWLTSQEGGKRWAINIVKFLVIVALFWLIAVIAGRLVRRALRMAPNVSGLMREFTMKSVRRVVLAIGVIIGLSALEVDIAPLLALIGAAGFVIAFALQGTLGNFASGLMILFYRPFDVGDVVDVAGVSGTVASLNLVSVTINTFDNKVMIVPNNSVWNDVITNATGSMERRVDLAFGISYDDDIGKALSIMERLVKEHPLVLETPEPVIRMSELGDSSVNFICRPWAKTADYWTVYWDLLRSVKEAFDKEGISIPFPQRDLHVYHMDKREQENSQG